MKTKCDNCSFFWKNNCHADPEIPAPCELEGNFDYEKEDLRYEDYDNEDYDNEY
jgi:hypothetical protein